MARKRRENPDLSHIAEPLRPLAVPMAGLVPDPANARTHPERNLAAIRNSLAAYGQRTPIVVNRRNNVIEKGNGTYAAALEMGWTQIAAVFVDDDPATQSGYSVADNRSGELAAWDEGVLAEQLRALEAMEIDLGTVGFDESELRALEKRLTTVSQAGVATIPPEDNYAEQYGVIVICEHEAHQQEVYDSLKGQGFNVKVVTT